MCVLLAASNESDFEKKTKKKTKKKTEIVGSKARLVLRRVAKRDFAPTRRKVLLLLCSLYFFLPGDGVKYTRGGDQSPKVKEAHQSQDRGPRRERETRRTRGPRQPQAKTKTRSPSSEKEGTKRCARPRDRKRERPTIGFVFGKTFDCFGHPSLLTEGGSFLPGASTRWDGKKSASNASKTRGIAR